MGRDRREWIVLVAAVAPWLLLVAVWLALCVGAEWMGQPARLTGPPAHLLLELITGRIRWPGWRASLIFVGECAVVAALVVARARRRGRRHRP